MIEKFPVVEETCKGCPNNIRKTTGKKIVNWCDRYKWNLDRIEAVRGYLPKTCPPNKEPKK